LEQYKETASQRLVASRQINKNHFYHACVTRWTEIVLCYVLCVVRLSAPGETVSIAEEMAARDALRRLWHLEQSHNPLPLDRKLQPSSGSSAVNKNTAAKART
jgi:hypothetical protein